MATDCLFLSHCNDFSSSLNVILCSFVFLSFSTIHLAVSAAVVPSTSKKHRTLGPEPALLFFFLS